jgi:hypothetical protein
MAKVHFTFANIPPRLSPIYPTTFANWRESPLYFRQHALMTFTNWRMSTVLSPVYVIYRLEDSLSTTLITESNKIQSDIFSPHMYPIFIVLCNKLQKSIILSPTYSHNFPQLARARRTFANTPSRLTLVGESPPYFHQHNLRTFAIGECPFGESLIGEIREPHSKLREIASIRQFR